ncbi:nucleoside/nucleotide kinase family protein [Cryobacterium lactosi]|uniref:Nucleoside/nucleotide kinase family protein n=1 Tax=Cryobacterium lactosi TaxID=1259202 RepID=A0A4R9BWR8_9MICO|nr:nucleoside/nucleotide kinase family protein [Cryobacterium lactosi]TFD93276.1 nucleoside/nucleotide kinase family protein [Cryobacterium lactosi]
MNIDEDDVDDLTLEDLARRVLDLPAEHGRIIVGITGSPGAGKTTLAKQLVDRLNEGDGQPGAVYLPMDGFHLANATLDRLGIHDRKGAIDTFDGWGFVALLNRVLDEQDHTVYAPSFGRTVDEGIAGEIAIPAGTRIVIAEGNYLLVDQEPWNRIPGLLAETWFCRTAAEERHSRLVDRHTRHGRSPEAADAWASSVDGANAILIEQTRVRADLSVSGAVCRG